MQRGNNARPKSFVEADFNFAHRQVATRSRRSPKSSLLAALRAKPLDGREPVVEISIMRGSVAPVLRLEVSLLLSHHANIDWVESPRREEAIRDIVDCCESIVIKPLKGRVYLLQQSDFNRHGMTVHLSATSSQCIEKMSNEDLVALEHSLESALQSHFGWEQAALSAQIEIRSAYNPSAPTREDAPAVGRRLS